MDTIFLRAEWDITKESDTIQTRIFWAELEFIGKFDTVSQELNKDLEFLSQCGCSVT